MKDKDSRADHDPDYAVPERLHADDIRRELSRIVQSSTFRDSYRLTSILSFIVETTLAGNGGKLKAYTIAVEALGRGPDFDPQTDPIVRVEAVRMRQALTRYYSGVGRDDPLVIEVPRGSYVPAFSRGGIAVLNLPAYFKGLPSRVVEAQAAGAPVLAAGAPGVREVCGDAAVWFDPGSVEQLADAMAAIGGRAPQLSEAGRRRAGEFSWARSAQAHRAAYSLAQE